MFPAKKPAGHWTGDFKGGGVSSVLMLSSQQELPWCWHHQPWHIACALPRLSRSGSCVQTPSPFWCVTSFRVVADVCEKDVWEFHAKSGSSGSCCLFLYFLGKIAVQEMSGRRPGSPRHPSSRHPRPSEVGLFQVISNNFRQFAWALLR